MQIGSAVAIYFIIWWLVFLPMLTLGNRDPDPEDSRVAGADRGAPARPLLRRKVAATTLVAAILFALVYGLLNSGLTLDDVPLPKPPAVHEYERGPS